MENQKLKILTQFKKQITLFLDELIDQFPQEGDLVVLRIFLIDQISTEEIMEYFSQNIVKKLSKEIENRDEKFFLENDVLYKSIDTDKVSYFKRLWPMLDEEDKMVVWKWFDLFVVLAEQYQKVSNNN